jgi:exosome complex component RRP4
MTRHHKNQDLVAPGDTLYEGGEVSAGPGAYAENGKIKSFYAGNVSYQDDEVAVTPRRGRYIPEEGDIVIGEISSVRYNSWNVELGSPYEAMLRLEGADEYIDLDEDDLTDYYEVGDAVIVKIESVSNGFDVNVTMDDRRCRKLEQGRIESIPPSRVSSLIGKGGAIISGLKDQTGCSIIAGQNGRVWIQGDNHVEAAEAVKSVEHEANKPYLLSSESDLLDNEQ